MVSSGSSVLALSSHAYCHGTLADYQRAHDLESRLRDLVVNTPGAMNWIGDSGRFWYTRQVKGGREYTLVDTVAGLKKPA